MPLYFLLRKKEEVKNVETGCTLCPRRCGARRKKQPGRCGGGALPKVARAALHHWEEPCISGTRGSGAVFFSGCELGCVFCQNREISRGNAGKEVTEDRLAQIFLDLQKKGAHNLNLVTPLQYTPQILRALDRAKPVLQLPVVVNCGGYARVETLAQWQGAADIWLPDLKYHSSALSERYSGAEDYFIYAGKAILEMHRQRPSLVWGENGMLKQGLIVRHLILPGAWKDSLLLLDWLAEHLPRESFLLSIMRQYTPTEACMAYPEINRRLTTFEYQKVVDRAAELGFDGFIQEAGSAVHDYTPAFDLTGVE